MVVDQVKRESRCLAFFNSFPYHPLFTPSCQDRLVVSLSAQLRFTILTMRFLGLLTALSVTFATAQQYEGDTIDGRLPTIPGAEVAFFKIPDHSGKNNNLTLINYYSHGTNGARLVESNIQRAIIVIHGLLRDPWNYENDMLNALKVATKNSNSKITPDNVAVIAPYFTNGADKGYSYPFTDGLPAGQGSTTNALVWPGTQWSAGGNNQYPHNSRHSSSFFVLDTLIRYFDDKTLFPNLKQIVFVGHSLGGQMVQRYAAVGDQLNTTTPVTYWIGNPDSFVWLSEDRPLATTDCPSFDVYRAGYTNYTEYPMTYGKDVVAQGRAAILANYQSRQIAYGRALYDHGDDSFDCGANTTGADRNERFFFFIKAFPPSCAQPTGNNCDTVDLIPVSHDNGQMFDSTAGQSRIFYDNWDGKVSSPPPRQVFSPGESPSSLSSGTAPRRSFENIATYLRSRLRPRRPRPLHIINDCPFHSLSTFTCYNHIALY